MKKVIIIKVLMLIVLSCINAQASEPKGDEKIQETIKRIEEEKEKAREEEKEEEEEEEEEDFEEDIIEDEDEQDSSIQILDLIFRDLLDSLFEEYFFTLRFSNYPYQKTSDYRFNTRSYWDTENSRKVAFNLSNDFTLHFGETYGNVTKLAFNASAFHANLFHNIIFAESETLSLFSFNGGLTCHFPNVLLHSYIGGSLLDILNEFLISYGMNLQVFLPARFYLDIYNLNARYHSLRFNHLSGDLHYALNRFSVGLGYALSSYAGFNYHGPSIKVGIWF